MDEIATDDEVMLYITAYIATSNALGDAIKIFKRLEAVTFDQVEALGLMNERRALEDRAARNDRNFLAFQSEQIAMHPPTQDEVNTIVSLASEVAQLTLQATQAETVLALATDIADRFDDIQG